MSSISRMCNMSNEVGRMARALCNAIPVQTLHVEKLYKLSLD